MADRHTGNANRERLLETQTVHDATQPGAPKLEDDKTEKKTSNKTEK